MNKTLEILKRGVIALVIPAFLYLLLYLAAPAAIGWGSLWELLRQSIAAAILSWGMVFGLKIGIWNFSVGANVMFAAIIGGNISLRLGLGLLPTILVITLTGTLVGLLSGSLFILLRIPSVILTIGMMVILESATAVAFGGGGVTMLNDILNLSLFPNDVIVGVVLYIIAFALMYWISLGYNIRAVGSNIGASKLNGIGIDKTRILCLTVTGFFCGCYAFMAIAKGGVITPRVNMDSLTLTFDALIGGFIAIALEKQVNLIMGVFIGSFSIQLIKSCIIAFNMPSVFQQAIIAIFLLIIMAMTTRSPIMDTLRERMRRLVSRKQLSGN